MAEPRKPFLLRLDPVLYQELERWAQQELRSVNGQIEWILRQALAKRLGADPGAPPASQPRAEEK
ncbi:MAG: Arc family DNA-binding protein [Planctomycetota bacterium]|nr:MAG: Arc family DNA-binding protein [Planctomycetota bacterium]